MNIHWPTVVIQIVNFLILVIVLKKFLYKPVLGAMDAREKAVQDRIKEAEKREKEALKEKEKLEAIQAEFENAKTDEMAKVHKQAEEEKLELLKQANQEIRDKQLKFEQQMTVEKKSLYDAVSHIVAETLVNQTKDAFKELANADLENQMAEIFAKKLPEIKKSDLDKIVKNIKNNKEIEIASSFNIDEKNKKSIEKTLTEITNTKPKITYKKDNKVICGIEIISDSIIVKWGFTKYIENFNKSLNEALSKIRALKEEV